MVDSNAVDVFVSYANDDRDRVRPLVEKLKAAGCPSGGIQRSKSAAGGAT